jgi:hypothetical protein
MQILDVVNEMLGTQGFRPLNALTEPHAFRGAAQSTLARVNRAVQAKGWWFNREPLTLQPSSVDSAIYLPGDAISVRHAYATYVQRGNRLYNTETGNYTFESSVDVVVIRLIPFEDLPELAASHISATAVLEYQMKYDGDTAKGRQLQARVNDGMGHGTLCALQSEETRSSRVNLITSNKRLQRLKQVTRAARTLLR